MAAQRGLSVFRERTDSSQVRTDSPRTGAESWGNKKPKQSRASYAFCQEPSVGRLVAKAVQQKGQAGK